MIEKSFRNVFVTVGTTRFDKLLAEIDSGEVQETFFNRLGTRRLIVQVGKSTVSPKCTKLIYSVIEFSF